MKELAKRLWLLGLWFISCSCGGDDDDTDDDTVTEPPDAPSDLKVESVGKYKATLLS